VRFDAAGSVALTNAIQAVDHMLGEFYPHTDTLGVVSVDAAAPAQDYADTFAKLRDNADAIADIDRYRSAINRAPDHQLDLALRITDLPMPILQLLSVDTMYSPPIEWNDAMPDMNWLASSRGLTWIIRDHATGKENADIKWEFNQGDIVKIRIFNDPRTYHPMQHPIHLHGQRFLVVARDGVPVKNLAWKDTAIVPVGATVDFLVDLSNPGEWMLHCHISEHMHSGMMMSFTVKPSSAAGRTGN
jgi:suppressor of ftsI